MKLSLDTDSEGRIVWMNNAGERMLNRMLGRRHRVAWPSRDRHAITRGLRWLIGSVRRSRARQAALAAAFRGDGT